MFQPLENRQMFASISLAIPTFSQLAPRLAGIMRIAESDEVRRAIHIEAETDGISGIRNMAVAQAHFSGIPVCPVL